MEHRPRLVSVGPTSRLDRSMLAIFSGPSIPVAALSLPLVVQIPEFYASYVGVKLAVVGLVFMIVRLFDVAFDPLLGAMIDATHTRFGKFRPWLASGVGLMMLSVYLCFMPRPGDGAGHLFVSLLLLYVSYSIVLLGHTAWAAGMADNYHERSRIFAWLQNVAVAAMALVLLLPPLLSAIDPADKAAGVRAMGWFIIFFAPLTIGLVLWRIPEPQVHPAKRVEGALSLLGRFVKLATQASTARILLADVCFAMASGITGALFIFYFRDARGYPGGMTNLLLFVYFLGGLAGAPLCVKIARRIDKHRTLIAAALYSILLQGATLALPKGAWIFAIPMLFAAGLAYSVPTIMLRSMLADTADEARLRLGTDDTSLLYAMITSTQKIASAVSVGLSYSALSWAGFVPAFGAHNAVTAVTGLEALFVGLPIVFFLFAAVVLRRYRLTEAAHKHIREALEKIDG